MRTKKFQRMLVALLMVCMVGMLGVFALAEDGGITITSQSVQETTEDLTVDYAYPAFAAEDEALVQALDTVITQACAAQLEALREEYKAFAADRTEEQQQLYTDDEAYRDEITGTYDVLSNDGRLLQILTTVSYRPAGGNGDWDRLNTYVFDLEGRRLLALTDVFADEESAIYAALTEAVTVRLDTLDGIYDDAAVIVDADTCFYLDDAEMALHLVFEPYALSKEDQDVALDIGALPLEPTAIVPGGMIGMPNPMADATADEFAAVAGQVHVPEGAEDVSYYLYTIGAETMAEAQFTMDGISYTLRAQAAEEAMDLSGLYVSFTNEDAATVNGHEGTVAYNEGDEGVCQWYDAEAKVSYSLSMDQGASAEALTELTDMLYA